MAESVTPSVYLSQNSGGRTHLGMTRKLTSKQLMILRLLADAPKSARHIEYDGFGFTRAAAYGHLQRLGMRGLVDVAGWNTYNERIYFLTDKGHKALGPTTEYDDMVC